MIRPPRLGCPPGEAIAGRILTTLVATYPCDGRSSFFCESRAPAPQSKAGFVERDGDCRCRGAFPATPDRSHAGPARRRSSYSVLLALEAVSAVLVAGGIR